MSNYFLYAYAGVFLNHCQPLRHLLRRWIAKDKRRERGIIWNVLDHTWDGLDY